MPLLSISQQGLRNATSSAADSDLVRIKDGRAVTARQSFFGRVLRIFPGGNREARVENAAIRHVLLADLRRSHEAGIATAAMEMVGLGATQGNAKPITVRQIREAHACAKVLSDHAQRAAAGLTAAHYYPAAPGFADLARDTNVEPTALTDAQQSHYQYMLQKHVALDPQRYLADSDAVRNMAVKALKYVSRMSDADIETAQNRLTTQRYLADEVFAGLRSAEGANSLVANLQRLHTACQFGIADTMLGDTEYGAYLTVDELALEHAAAKLTPQQARKAYEAAMANDGIGRSVLSAIAEQGDEFGRRSLNAKLPREQERQLEVAALRAREFQSTTETVLKVLGRRGGIDNPEREIRDITRRTPERARAALGAQATVRHQLVRAIDKETAQLKLRAAEFTKARAQARDVLLSGELVTMLQQRGLLDTSGVALHEVRARVLGPLSRQLHELEHDVHAGVPDANGVRTLLDKVLSDTALHTLDLQTLQRERQELGAPKASDSEAVRSWRSYLDTTIDALIAAERAADMESRTTSGSGTLIPVTDEALLQRLATEDTLLAEFGADMPASPMANDFYQDMHRMQVVLGSGENGKRIGMPTTPEPTDDDLHAAKLDGFEQLVEFVGDAALAARVSRFINQKLFGPMNAALAGANSPIALADGTRGSTLPAARSLSVTLSKTATGDIQVHVEQRDKVRALSTADGPRELDPQRSYVNMSFDFAITPHAIQATSPVTYDFRFAEAE